MDRRQSATTRPLARLHAASNPETLLIHDVAVVGAGPVGLALGLGLARAGRDVLVLEKEAGTAEHSRAPAIWPRTQEILAGLDVLDRFLARGMRREVVELFDVDRDDVLLRLPIQELKEETAFPWLLILRQSETERLLLEALRRQPSGQVRFGREVVGLETGTSDVRLETRGQEGPEAHRARFVVGCDGARSTVRQILGASFEGTTYDQQAALADIAFESQPAEATLRFPRLSTRRGLAIAIRIDESLWRLILPFLSDDGTVLHERIDHAVESLFPGSGSYETIWQSEFRLHRRISSRFAVGRVALAGDAAHLNSPVGGQGMNAGIQDVSVLLPLLLRALEGGPDALSEYDAERREAIGEGVNRFTNLMTRSLFLGNGRFFRTVLGALSLVLRVGPFRRKFLRRLAMLEQ